MSTLFLNTELTYEQISSVLGISTFQVHKYLHKIFTKELIKERKHKTYRNSRKKDKNPMFGKFGKQHHSFIGDISDGKGYILCVKPSWYTGRKGTHHIFKHHKVMCEYLSITEIPKGWCVHHKDEDKTNNKISNLEYMTITEHCRHHMLGNKRNKHCKAKELRMYSKEVELL